MYNVVSWILKDKQNNIFVVFKIFGQCSLDFNKLVIKAKMHAKTLFFFLVYEKHNMIF
jgi:hypothetical protein